MANINKTYTFVTGQVADATQVNKDFDDIIAGVGDLTLKKTDNVSAPDKVLGRVSAGAGPIEEIPCTAAGRALLDDADAAAQRTTLGGGATLSLFNCGSYTGDGTNNRAVSAGFQPKLVYVRAVYAGANTMYSIRIDATSGLQLSQAHPGGLEASVAGVALSATGFITGSSGSANDSGNINTIPYRWEAWG
jgi:hypothetical protein